VALLGEPGAGHLGGSLYLREAHGLRGVGTPPPLHYVAEKALHVALRKLVREGLVEVAHDLSDGGLAVALAECTLPVRSGDEPVGATLTAPDEGAGGLFGEDHGRAVIAYDPARADAVRVATGGVPLRVLGRTGGDTLRVGSRLSVAVAEIADAWESAFPKYVG
jgi:phosphoribosylformylglycinamidine synthase